MKVLIPLLILCSIAIHSIAQQALPCIDTSYVKRTSITNGSMYLESSTKTFDGGVLVTAELHDTSQPSPARFWKTYVVLIKFDQTGQVSWLKQFEELSPVHSTLYDSKVFELANHDIIFSTLIDTSSYTKPKNVIYRLSSNGTILWKNCLQSNLGIFGAPTGAFTIMVKNAADGLNGDVLISGVNAANISYGTHALVMRLNNLGQLVWDANYGNYMPDGAYLFGASGVATLIENGQITFVGLSGGGTFGEPAILFLTLDYNTGNLVRKRLFRTSYTDANTTLLKSFRAQQGRFVRLVNGHSLFYGELNSDAFQTTPVIDHFGVVEFDQSYNLVNAYSISSAIKCYYDRYAVEFDPSGKGLFSVFQLFTAYESNIYFGSLQNQQIRKQRVVYSNNTAWPGISRMASLNDGGYAYLQSPFTIQNGMQSYIEFRKMHDSDTSSVCLGRDTNVFQIFPINYIEDPSYRFLDPNEGNRLVEVPASLSQTDTLTTAWLNPCLQTSYCDTLKIHGIPAICGSATYLDFTSFKRNTCGGITQWSIDNNAIDSIKTTSDSSARIWFKDINWQGKLYAGLSGSTCYTPAADSMTLSIIKTQSQIDLGTDNKVLCTPNTMVLHAGNYFSTYNWQDGSTDSILTVSTPGKYWVEAHDKCGNTLSDTIIILPFTETINVGPDRTKCNNDTLRLNAPGGFVNYQWSNNYFLNTITPQNVVVDPLIDTAYYLKAEKTPGCFVYDTVRITVHTSPPIQLGADTSFCNGQSILLDAGSGFNSYVWNTASTSQQINVTSAGSYAVIGTMANGCRSYDTLRVLSVWLQPAFSLNHDPNLCVGESRTLTPGNFAAYLWQDGSTGKTFTVTSLGRYFVTVQDNHACSASDTVQITTMLPAPAAFLPADTAVCSYGKLEIIPRGTYASYLWSTSATTSTITVKKAGVYWLNVTDNHNCSGKDSINVLPKECLTGFYVPNAFTPNHDGKNDLFKPIIGGIVEQYQFMIYNRWGQLLFSSNDRIQGWDGSVGGKPQGNNTFVWICRFKLEGDESERLERGTVTLIR
jgi:gliding motility-associated-like protein